MLIKDDCLNAIKDLDDNSVDAIITDPPYLTTDLHFDKDGLNMQWVNESLRIVKPDGYLIVFCPIAMSAHISNIWSLRFSGVWLKTLAGMRTHTAKKPRSKSELYTVFAHPEHKIKKTSLGIM